MNHSHFRRQDAQHSSRASCLATSRHGPPPTNNTSSTTPSPGFHAELMLIGRLAFLAVSATMFAFNTSPFTEGVLACLMVLVSTTESMLTTHPCLPIHTTVLPLTLADRRARLQGHREWLLRPGN